MISSFRSNESNANLGGVRREDGKVNGRKGNRGRVEEDDGRGGWEGGLGRKG